MDRQENQRVVHEVMQTFYDAVNGLLPDAWLRRWTEPQVDAEALIRSLADSIEDLWVHVDSLVFRVQRQELAPEDALAQAREHLIATLHQLLPTVEVRQRMWRSRKIGTLVELAEYQVTLDRLLFDLRAIAQRIARPGMSEEFGWPAFAPAPDLPATTQFWEGTRARASQAPWPVGSLGSLASTPTSWARDRGQRQPEPAAGRQAQRHVRVTRRLLVDGRVVREDVAEAEVPLALGEEAAVAAVEAQLPPYLPRELASSNEPASGAGMAPSDTSAA